MVKSQVIALLFTLKMKVCNLLLKSEMAVANWHRNYFRNLRKFNLQEQKNLQLFWKQNGLKYTEKLEKNMFAKSVYLL